MATIKDQAIVLRRLDYSETSQVLVFLTRLHGQRRLIAKGIKRSSKKKFAVAIDLLERGEVMFVARSESDRTLGTLTEWRQADLYLGLRGNLQRWYEAQYAAEITAGLTGDSDPHPEVFDALVQLIALLAEPGIGPESDALESCDDTLPLLVGYQKGLLSAVGLWPDLTRCVLCDRPAPPGRAGYFSAHQGGLICRDCEPHLPEKRKAGAATLTALRENSWTRETAKLAFELLDYTIAHTLGHRPALTRSVLSSRQ